MSKRLYREFYLLPRREQRGLIILSLLLILSLLFRITIRLLPEKAPEGMEEFEQEARLLIAALAEADSLQQNSQEGSEVSITQHPGRTYPSSNQNYGSNVVRAIDINRADSADLLPLTGIGPVFAGRIIKYRNLLGGFVSADQLGEVYGIPSETVRKSMSRVLIDSSAVRKIHIDSATFSELLRHPYLEYEDVKALVRYREFKGDISSENELRINHIMHDSTLRKLDGYFDYR